MKHLFLFISVLLLCSSCKDKDIEMPHNRTTKFTPERIHIGMQKYLVIQMFGEPFSIDSYNDDGRIDILCYKEIVDIEGYPYILTTTLYFNNTILEKIDQESERT